jgi:hypothetical protein
MRRLWLAVAVLGSIILVADARADTVYLTNGQSFWGTQVYEEGDYVIVERPGGELKFPKAQVSKIEHLRSTLPPFYVPPGEPSPEQPEAAAGPAGASAPAAPGASAGVTAPGPPGGAVPVSPPTGRGPTQLPPPPPPPPYGAPK